MDRTPTRTCVTAKAVLDELTASGKRSIELTREQARYVVGIETVNPEVNVPGYVTGLPLRPLRVGEPVDIDEPDSSARLLLVSAGRAWLPVYEILPGRVVTRLEGHHWVVMVGAGTMATTETTHPTHPAA